MLQILRYSLSSRCTRSSPALEARQGIGKSVGIRSRQNEFGQILNRRNVRRGQGRAPIYGYRLAFNALHSFVGMLKNGTDNFSVGGLFHECFRIPLAPFCGEEISTIDVQATREAFLRVRDRVNCTNR